MKDCWLAAMDKAIDLQTDLILFNPSDYSWIPSVADPKASDELRFEWRVNADGNYEGQVTQTMMPLIRLR